MNDTIDSGTGTMMDDAATPMEFQVTADSLALADGTKPEVGDPVTFKVSGTVKEVVNGICTVTPETVNDQAIPEKPQVQSDASEMDSVRNASLGMGLE